MAKKWYTIHVYSGFEKSVKRSLEERIQREQAQEFFGEIYVPTEEVQDIKDGRKTISERKIYPGYIFIEMEMTDETRYLVKSTPKVTGFLGGSGTNPTPISKKEMDEILRRVDQSIEKPKPKVEYNVGDMVRVNSGPFEDFNGKVEMVNYDKNKLTITMLIFERETPIEVDFSQVEKTNE